MGTELLENKSTKIKKRRTGMEKEMDAKKARATVDAASEEDNL